MARCERKWRRLWGIWTWKVRHFQHVGLHSCFFGIHASTLLSKWMCRFRFLRWNVGMGKPYWCQTAIASFSKHNNGGWRNLQKVFFSNRFFNAVAPPNKGGLNALVVLSKLFASIYILLLPSQRSYVSRICVSYILMKHNTSFVGTGEVYISI